jgi:hypothetical protein
MSDDIITKDEAIDRMKAGLPCETSHMSFDDGPGWTKTRWEHFDPPYSHVKFRKPPEPRRVARDFWLLFGKAGFSAIYESAPTVMCEGEKAIHVREVLPGDVVVNKAERAGTVAHFEGMGPSVTGVIWVNQPKPEPGVAVYLHPPTPTPKADETERKANTADLPPVKLERSELHHGEWIDETGRRYVLPKADAAAPDASMLACWVCEARNEWCERHEENWLNENETGISAPDCDEYVGQYISERLAASPARVGEGEDRLLREMQRYLPILERIEAHAETWDWATRGTGVATLNGYRAAMSREAQ